MKKNKFYFFISLLSQLLFPSISAVAQVTFVHISDLHISDVNSLVNTCDVNGVMAQCYLEEFAALNPKPAFVLATGDISNIGNKPSDGMYPALTQHLYPGSVPNPTPGQYFIDSAKTIPIYFTPGNHDYYTFLTPPLSSATMNYYPERLSPDTDYVVTVNNAVILFVRSGYDDNRPFWEDPNIFSPEGSGLTNAQCNWIRNVLSANGTKRKIIVMHHPPVNVAGTYFDGTPYTGPIFDEADGSILNNRTTFLNICDSNHVDVVLAGHRHQNVVASRGGRVVNENWPDSTRYVQTAPAFDGSYRVITVDSFFINVSPPLLTCTTTTAVNPLSNNFNSQLFPNPFSESAVLEIETRENAFNYELRIFDVWGHEVKNITNINANKTIVDRGNLSAGIYFYKIYNSNGIVGAGKLIIIEQ